MFLVLAIGCGSGSDRAPSGSPSPTGATPRPASPTPTPDPSGIPCEDAFEEGEVFLAVAQILGVAPANGIASTKRVLIRVHRGVAEVLDVAGGDEPHWRGRIFFSAPQVAWSWSEDGENAVLLRSDDAGITWQRVSPIPRAATLQMELSVDEQRGLAVALVNQGLGSFGTPGPYVYRTRLGSDDWQLLDVPPAEWLKPSWFGLGARDGRIEVPRWWPTLRIYDVTDQVAATPVDVDDRFQPGGPEYATFVDHGWIGGQFLAEPGGVAVPAVLASRAGDAWQLATIAGVDGGRLVALDFANAEQGITCGEVIGIPLSSRFCAFSDDGGSSWALAGLPDGQAPIRGAARSPCGAGVVAVTSAASVLTSDDGGRSWSEQMLPRLGDQLDVGPVARNSRSGASTSAVAIAPPPTLDLPPPAPLAPGAPGPVVWAAGDSVERGPTIMGLLLRSEDAGLGWTPILGVPGGSLSSVAFVDRLNGWAVGAGRILRTDDGGASFVDQTAGVALEAPPAQTRIVSARDAEHAIVVARGRPAGSERERDLVLVTSDGGASWRSAARPDLGIVAGAGIGDACLTAGGSGILMDETRVLLTRDGGETWDFGPDFPFSRPESGSSGEGFTDPVLHCSGQDDLWIVGSDVDPRNDTLWHSSDGGRTWRDLSAAVGSAPERGRPVASFLASGDGWIVLPRAGERPQVLRTRDGGARWATLVSPFLDHELPVAMAFGDDRHGVLLTSDRRILRTADGGDTWAAGSAPADFAPLAVGAAP
ncbi:hypothetical protein K2Z84_06025 [Candidatus Binatia bacterium]|nr:hypothetical protein [Candidatus Binatia bacterium]